VTEALREAQEGLRLVWIADRGFARLNLFQFLRDLGVDFAIRVNAKTLINWNGKKLLLRDLPLKEGQILWLEGILRPEGRPFERGGIRVNLLVAWKRPKRCKKKKQREPWYVVTTLGSAQQTLSYYRRRPGLMRVSRTGSRDWG
jgi:hypothetical protein